MKPGRNDPCPCGSGKKHKKCCGGSAFGASFTSADRQRAFARLEQLALDALGSEDDAAFEELWGRWIDQADQLSGDLELLSEAVFDAWFSFDRPLSDGRLVVDVLLEDRGLSVGERNFLTLMRDSAMHLWEVEDVVPGVSLSLRDVLENDRVTVAERSGSRQLARHEWIAARVIPRGVSGQPELELGVLHVPRLLHDDVRSQLTRQRAEFERSHPDRSLRLFYKELPPFFHDQLD